MTYTIMEHLKFKSPFSMIVSGPSGSGKTVLIRKLLSQRHHLFNSQPQHILWCYGQYQDAYAIDIPNTDVTYYEGFPDKDYLLSNKPSMVIIDDLMNELTGDKEMSNLFTKFSHHMNIDVIFIVQNIFHHGKEMRTISLNTHYFMLLKNPRDMRQALCLATQTHPNNTGYFMDAYKDAIHKPYGYLLVDLKPDTPDEFRLRTRIFPSESIKGLFSPVIYFPDGENVSEFAEISTSF